MIILRYRKPKLLHSDISKLPLTYLFLSGIFIKLHPCSSLWGEKQPSTSLKTTDIFHLDNSVLSIWKRADFTDISYGELKKPVYNGVWFPSINNKKSIV